MDAYPCARVARSSFPHRPPPRESSRGAIHQPVLMRSRQTGSSRESMTRARPPHTRRLPEGPPGRRRAPCCAAPAPGWRWLPAAACIDDVQPDGPDAPSRRWTMPLGHQRQRDQERGRGGDEETRAACCLRVAAISARARRLMASRAARTSRSSATARVNGIGEDEVRRVVRPIRERVIRNPPAHPAESRHRLAQASHPGRQATRPTGAATPLPADDPAAIVGVRPSRARLLPARRTRRSDARWSKQRRDQP